MLEDCREGGCMKNLDIIETLFDVSVQCFRHGNKEEYCLNSSQSKDETSIIKLIEHTVNDLHVALCRMLISKLKCIIIYYYIFFILLYYHLNLRIAKPAN